MTRHSTLGLSALLSAFALSLSLAAVSPAEARSGEAVDRVIHTSARQPAKRAETGHTQLAINVSGVFSDVSQFHTKKTGRAGHRRTKR